MCGRLLKNWGLSFSPLYFEVLLMECEQVGLLEHEIALLKGLEGRAGNHGTEIGFGTATRLAETNEMTEVS